MNTIKTKAAVTRVANAIEKATRKAVGDTLNVSRFENMEGKGLNGKARVSIEILPADEDYKLLGDEVEAILLATKPWRMTYSDVSYLFGTAGVASPFGNGFVDVPAIYIIINEH